MAAGHFLLVSPSQGEANRMIRSFSRSYQSFQEMMQDVLWQKMGVGGAAS